MKEKSNHSRRTVFSREILLKRLKEVVEKIPNLDLPANIVAIYAFGGVLRDKTKLHDIDLICLYSWTNQQDSRWKRFFDNFNNLSHGAGPSPLSKLWPTIGSFYERGISLSKAIEDDKVAQILAENGVPPQWAACFSWTEVANNPHGIFVPYIEMVLQKMLVKNARGLSFVFLRYEEFMADNTPYNRLDLNTVLAWSIDKPDIEANLFGRTLNEKENFLRSELDKFLSVISDSEIEIKVMRDKLEASSLELNFKALADGHSKIVSDPADSLAELADKCERARIEMRRYEEELQVLKTIDYAAVRYRENDYRVLGNPFDEQIAYLTLIYQPKQLVKEERIREILKTLGIPEHKVITKKQKGYRTEYELLNMIWRNKEK